MPHVTLQAGDIHEIYRSRQRGEAIFVETDGDILVGREKGRVSDGRKIPADMQAEFTIPERDEPVWVYAAEDATVRWELQGFSVSLFGREVVRIDGNETRGRIPQDQQRRSSEGVTEVNADQTTSISGGSSQTTTVTADADEVWLLRGFLFEYTSDGVDFDATLETEDQAVELGYADSVGAPGVGDSYFYKSGGWGGSGGYNGTRNDVLRGHKIDDTNGLNLVFNNTGSGSISNTRTIRYEFEVIRA